MKTLLSIFSLIICIGLFSCSKTNSPTVGLPLVGAWHLVNDTTTSSFGPSSAETVSVYKGTAADQYIFNMSGTFSLHQDTIVNSGRYTIDGKYLELTNPSLPSNYNTTTYYISQLTDHRAVLIYSFITPGGASFQTITLTK